MFRHAARAVAATVVFSFAGCGTVETRVPGYADNRSVGWPLFDAVVTDCWYLFGAHGDGVGHDPMFLPFFLLSLPVDCAIDLVLIPVDVIFGVLGYNKHSISPR